MKKCLAVGLVVCLLLGGGYTLYTRSSLISGGEDVLTMREVGLSGVAVYGVMRGVGYFAFLRQQEIDRAEGSLGKSLPPEKTD